MPRWIVWLLVATSVWCFAVDPAFAGKRVALVVGNSAYEHVSGLPNPTRDAADVAAALRGIGFAVKELQNAGRNDFAAALSDFSDTAAGADFAIVYYAGHGIEVDRQNYLIPVDARLATDRRLRFEALSLDDVLAALDGVKGIRMVLLDACRNNPFASSMTMTSASRTIGRGLSRVEAANGTVISFAAKEGTTAADGDGRNSPFTAALLANITKPGLEIQFLLRKIRDSVMTSTNGAQEPYISASLSGDEIYLVPPLPKIDTPEVAAPPVAPTAPVVPQVPATSTTVQDDWDAVKKSDSEIVLRAFIEKHADDRLYRSLAEERLSKLKSQQTRLPNPVLPEVKPKKQEMKTVTPIPTTKNIPIAKAKSPAQAALGPRPNATGYCWSLKKKHVLTMGFESSSKKQTKYGLIECYSEKSGLRGAWK